MEIPGTIFFLTWCDIKVRYKQTMLGAAWAILQPMLTMIVFSIVFGGLAKLPSEGILYPIFSFTVNLLLYQRTMWKITKAPLGVPGA